MPRVQKLAAILVLAMYVCASSAGEPTKPLPEKLVKEWEQRTSARVGWLSEQSDGTLKYDEGNARPRDLPAFLIRQDVKNGVLGKLPVPTAPFGVLILDTSITDVGLKELAQFKELRAAYLGGSTKVTDKGIKELSGLKNLHTLFISDTQLTDAGLKDLAALKDLRGLDLGKTKITDAGLKELGVLKKLQYLHLASLPKVTDGGIKELQKALPKCKIER